MSNEKHWAPASGSDAKGRAGAGDDEVPRVRVGMHHTHLKQTASDWQKLVARARQLRTPGTSEYETSYIQGPPVQRFE